MLVERMLRSAGVLAVQKAGGTLIDVDVLPASKKAHGDTRQIADAGHVE